MFYSKLGTCSFYLQHFTCSAGPILYSIRAKDGLLCMCYSVSRLKRKQFRRMVRIFDINILSSSLFSVVQGFSQLHVLGKIVIGCFVFVVKKYLMGF